MSAISSQRQWIPPDQLKINKENGWSYKYMRKSDVEKRLDEGWEICRKDEKILKETGAVDTTQNYRGLILMRMPTHMVEQRNKFYRDMHERRLRAAGRGSGMVTKADEINKHTHSDDNTLTGALGSGLTLKEGVITDDGLQHSKTTNIPIGGREDDRDLEAEQSLKEAKERTENHVAESDQEVVLEPSGGKSTPKRAKRR